VRLRLPPTRSRAPLAIAAFIGIPLFFSTLMAATLALEKPVTYSWKGGKHGLLTTYHDPSTRNVLTIWLLAMVPPLTLTLIGWIATRLPLGFYIPCATAIVMALAVVHKTAVWERHHTSRYPVGVDLIPPQNAASDKFDRGEWEHMARETAVSLQHWTIGVAVASALVMAGLYVRRRFFSRKPMLPLGQLEGVHAPDATTPSLGDPVQ
jgi:hypothetical protein